MLARWRDFYNKKSVKVARGVASTGVHPNTITILTLFYNIAVAYLIYREKFFLSAWLLIGSLFLDGLDGAVARAQGKASKKGTLLDHFCDRVAEFFIFLAIALSGLVSWWIVFTVFFFSIMTSYVRARAESLSGGNCEVGLVGRFEKISILIVGLFFPGYMHYLMIFLGVLCLITVIQRLYHSFRYLL